MGGRQKGNRTFGSHSVPFGPLRSPSVPFGPLRSPSVPFGQVAELEVQMAEVHKTAPFRFVLMEVDTSGSRQFHDNT